MDTTPAGALAVARRAQQDLGMAGISAEALQTARATSAGYCTLAGCWSQIDLWHASFSGEGSYGYGTVPLGQVEMYFQTEITGASLRTRPFWFKSTRGTRSVVLSTEDLYISAGQPQGAPQNPRLYAQRPAVNASAASIVSWPSPGKAWPNAVSGVSNVAEVTWSDTSSKYPGSWYMWAKSVKMGRQSNGGYQFVGVTHVPTAPNGAGYRR